MTNDFSLAYKLNRLDSATGYLLVFFPASFGFFLSNPKIEDFFILIKLFVGSVCVRGAGCIINDLLDRNIDVQVARTKKRNIASGDISPNKALIILYISLLFSLAVLLSMSVTSIIIGIAAFAMILSYPLAKRFTYFPQFILGLTFNLGVFIGYAAKIDVIETEAVIIYVACIFWTIGYDTIYAFMDIKDEKRIGVKSMAVFLEKQNYRFWIMFFYTLFTAIMSVFFLMRHEYITLSGFVIVFAQMCWQVYTLDISTPKNCSIRFKSNNFVGLTIFVFMLMEYFYN